MKGYRTSWTVPDEHRESPKYLEAGARITLGQTVHTRRTALGLTQTALATQTGIPPTVIAQLEGGAVPPTGPLLDLLASVLGVESSMHG